MTPRTIKEIFLLLLFVIIPFVTFGQKFKDFDHKYTISTYYVTISFVDSVKYKLKTSMYGDSYINGSYNINDDTVKLSSLFAEGKYFSESDLEFKFLSRAFGKLLIKDSLLLPEILSPTSIFIKKRETIEENDSLIYCQSDRHVNQYINIRKENIYQYWSRSDIGPAAISNGTYKILKNKIYFMPREGDYILKWFCSGNCMYFVRNFLIGKKEVKDNKDCFVYFTKM